MPTTPVTFEEFGGLNLGIDPAATGPIAAVDLSNVDVDRFGRLKTRPGFADVGVSPAATSADGLAAFETTGGTYQFVLAYTNGATKKYAGYASTGGAAVATATPTNTRLNAVRYGDPTHEYLYIGNGLDTVWRWDGAAFTQPAGMPPALFLAVDVNSNRLVAAHTTNGHAVEWSDPGLPETWTSGNSILLTPGDGSKIWGLASWQDYVFAFKERRFFVFYGESEDSDGGPIFNYHTVDGYGTVIPPAAGDEGVYFFDGRSVWVTTGNVPVDVSKPVEAFIRGDIGLGGQFADQTKLDSVRLFYSRGRLYVRFATTGAGAGFRTFVFDPKTGHWTTYLVGIDWITTLRTAVGGQQYTHFASGSGSFASVYKFDPSATTDSGGAPISWSWTSGATDLGTPGRVKVTLESRLWGSGSVNLEVATDYGSFDNPGYLALGTAPAIDDAWQLLDREGTIWQHRFLGITAGSVHRLAHYVSFVKPAGIE